MKNIFTILIFTSLLCSCGVKGDLYLPGQKPPHGHKTVENNNNQTTTINKDK